MLNPEKEADSLPSEKVNSYSMPSRVVVGSRSLISRSSGFFLIMDLIFSIASFGMV